MKNATLYSKLLIKEHLITQKNW